LNHESLILLLFLINESFKKKNLKDHGKSTLADRLMEITSTISANKGNRQVLDKLKVQQN